MLRILLLVALLAPPSAPAASLFDGPADFADDASRALALELLEAHGGMAPMRQAASLQFSFFTKMLGNPHPFYSLETLDLATGAARVDWPFWDAAIGWDGRQVWSRNWPMPLPAGFFVRLSASFLTLPWQLHQQGARVAKVDGAKLPEGDTLYEVLRVTYTDPHPGIPGTFYEVYIHPETRLMAGIRFDINHPGMVANPKQPIGPNFHAFDDYRSFGGLVIPTFYQSWGQGAAAGGKSNAYHFVWNVRLDQPFDEKRSRRPEDAQVDEISLAWWQVRQADRVTQGAAGPALGEDR